MTTSNEPVESSHVLELIKVGKTYGSEPAVHALVDVDLALERGEWLSITGPSGAGKSTLLNVIGCLDSPTSGQYLFDGIDTAELTDGQRAGLRSQRIGFIFQSFHLLPYRTVLENVMLSEVYRKQPARDREARAMAAIERVGLGHRADFSPGKLSGGEQQRVAIARALVGSPSLLLCDEPTGNLDSKTSANLLDLFDKLNSEGLTLVIVTHDENIANRARRRVHIIDGRLTDITSGGTVAKPECAPTPKVSAQKVARSGITIRDLFNESLAGMFARPGRMMLTVLGVVIGLTAVVATFGLSRTAGNRIVSQFDQVAATELFVSARPGMSGLVDPKAIPWDAPARLRRLNGVVAAGTMSEVDVQDALISATAVKDPLNQTAFKLSVHAASPELFRAVRADLVTGRVPDEGHSERADRVAVLGADAARRLGVTGLEALPAIYIGDQLYLVIGILKDVARKPELLGSVIIPEGTARKEYGLVGPGTVVVETQIGAANLIAGQTQAALRPDAEKRVLKVDVPQEPRRVRDDVQSDVNVMFLLLGGLSLVVGAIGIANITLVSVMERTAEIGLRRAIGATRRHIATQFLLESASMGVIGGILGASLGVILVVVVSAFETWTPVLDPWAPFLAPLIGGAIGLLSGLYPALRAAHLEPVEAFRK